VANMARLDEEINLNKIIWINKNLYTMYS
jgi:hypothetical protein